MQEGGGIFLFFSEKPEEKATKNTTNKKATGFAVLFGNPYYIRGKRGNKCRYFVHSTREKKHALCCRAMPDFPNNREGL